MTRFMCQTLKQCLADASLHVPLDEIKVDKTLRFIEEPVENSDREVKRFLTSLLDDGRGSGSWMFLFVWSGYAAMHTLLWAGKVVSNHNLWDIIVNGDLEDEATPFGEQSNPHVPKTVKQLAARRNQERIKSILLLAIPDEYLLKFHNVPDAKSLWAVIKSRFGRLMKLVLPVDILGVQYSWWELHQVLFYSQVLMHIVYSLSCTKQNQSQLENEDFQQMMEDDLEELDLRWQVAMLTVRVKKFIQRTGRNMDFKESKYKSRNGYPRKGQKQSQNNKTEQCEWNEALKAKSQKSKSNKCQAKFNPDRVKVHGALISKEDINQKFLRSLPPSWNQIALIMRNKPDIDDIDIDDLYNNLKVYEDEMKRSSSSTPTSQNLAFLSSENTSSTNEVSNASGDFGVSTAGGTSQIDGDDLEELDLRWQVAMLTIRVKKFIQRTGRNMNFKEKRPVSLDKSKIECYNCHRKGHFARECRAGRNQGRRSYCDNGRSNAPTNESSSKALVAQDGLGGYDWSNDFEIEPVNYDLMAISSSSSSSSSDNEVQKCSKQCLESFKTLQKNYDSEREKHSRARLEIQGYKLALESL
ncbi:ribonuclease H-like domain-containing protein [Tanacetum coccineum]